MRYRKAAFNDRIKILDEFVALSGYHRKHATRVLCAEVGEEVMGINKDEVKGRAKEVEGKIKEVAGKLVGNEKLEEEGKNQKTIGEAKAAVGDVKKDVKDAVKKA